MYNINNYIGPYSANGLPISHPHPQVVSRSYMISSMIKKQGSCLATAQIFAIYRELCSLCKIRDNFDWQTIHCMGFHTNFDYCIKYLHCDLFRIGICDNHFNLKKLYIVYHRTRV